MFLGDRRRRDATVERLLTTELQSFVTISSGRRGINTIAYSFLMYAHVKGVERKRIRSEEFCSCKIIRDQVLLC